MERMKKTIVLLLLVALMLMTACSIPTAPSTGTNSTQAPAQADFHKGC